jgi:hypothetical protein
MGRHACLAGSAEERALAIVGRCGAGRKGKHGWLVCCPAHEDRSPSLSVTAKGDHVLLRCFAGCTAAAIVEALALSMGDLFADDDWRPPLHPKPTKRKEPPPGLADPLALAFAVDLVIDDVEMLTVEGLVAVLKQAAGDPLQWLWLERAFHQAGMTPEVVWQVLYPHAECPYPCRRTATAPGPVQIQGRPLPSIRLGETRHG